MKNSKIYSLIIYLLLLNSIDHKKLFPSYTKEQKSHLYFINFSKAFPLNTTKSNFTYGSFYPKIGYSYITRTDVMIGFSLQKLNILEKISKSSLSFLSFSQDIFLKMRVYYPLFISPGIRLQYIRPLISPTKLNRHPKYKGEVAISTSILFIYPFTKNTELLYNLDIWRGVNRSDFKIFETGLAIGVKL